MNPPTDGSSATLESPSTAAAADQSSRLTLVTHLTIAASDERVWNSLQFYEEVDAPPPLLLRLFLPRPIPVAQNSTDVGREATLRYASGHYARRVIRLEPPRNYEFEVVEQQIATDRGVTLVSGAYTLRKIDSSHTDLSITTVYASQLRPRWLMQSVEKVICKRLQHHLLASTARVALKH